MTREDSSKGEFEAAFTTLSQYGFSKALVKRTLKDVLNVYGGDEGWPLIKENGYEVVVERLISDEGPKSCKSQRRDLGHIQGRNGQDSGNKQSTSDPRDDADDDLEKTRVVLDGENAVVDESCNSLLLTSILDPEIYDIYSHQQNLWTKNGSFSPPLWFKISSAAKEEAYQKFSYLHVLLKSSENDSDTYLGTRLAKDGNGKSEKSITEDLNIKSRSSNAGIEVATMGRVKEETHCFGVSQTSKCHFLMSENGQIGTPESVNDSICEMDTNSSDVKVPKDVGTECRGKCFKERHLIAENIQFLQQEPSLTVHMKTQKFADALHMKHDSGCTILDTRGTEKNGRRGVIGQGVKKRKRVFASQEFREKTSEATVAAQAKASLNESTEQRASQLQKSHLASEKSDMGDKQQSATVPKLDIARMSAFKLTRRRDGCPNPMFSRLQKCKQAVLGVSGSQNNQAVEHELEKSVRELPVSSTVCEKVEHGLMEDETEKTLNLGRESSAPICLVNGHDAETVCKKVEFCKQGSDQLVPSCKEKRMQVSSLSVNQSWAALLEVTTQRVSIDSSDSDTLPRFTEGSEPKSSQQSPASNQCPDLPPGFWEPSDRVSSQGSPNIPPGFWQPLETCTSQEPILLMATRVSGSAEEHQDPMPLQESPKLPPGFWEPFDPAPLHHYLPSDTCKFAEMMPSVCSPADLPPGFWETSDRAPGLSPPSGHCMFQKPSLRMARSKVLASAKKIQENRFSRNPPQRKGTPPNQIFIAGIPDGCERAEQTLFGLVKEILENFKFVPVSATSPRRIHVSGDHAFVEFCCEAVAGIFIDAYHANASALSIDGEQLVAARSLHLMKLDTKLRKAVGNRLKGQDLVPSNVFYLGNVPGEWQNEERLASHISTLLKGVTSNSQISEMLSVYPIPGFSDVYIHIASSILADTFYNRCMSNKEHLDKISVSLFVCRSSVFLPRAARVCVGPNKGHSQGIV